MKAAIRIENLSKRYRLGKSSGTAYRTLRESLGESMRGLWTRVSRKLSKVPVPQTEDRAECLWALRDVSFEIQPGEVIGIIGRNGAGKSTLLKILSRIMEPTEGRATVRGRMGSLLEVGTGFHPELTGRENIFLNGAILGMSRREIVRKFDTIVDFAEIGRFLDTPVKRYSSGMYVRLAFAVAAHLEPEILLVDEVLAVGDMEFQKKCLGRMSDVAREGRTVLFVSHNMSTVQNLCTCCFLMEKGRLAASGTPIQVIGRYNQVAAGNTRGEQCLLTHPGRGFGGTPCMRKVVVRSLSSADASIIYMKDDVEIEVAFEAPKPLRDINFGVVVKSQLQTPIFGVNNMVTQFEGPKMPIQKGSISCRLDKIPLMPGAYLVDLYFGANGENCDVVRDSVQLEVHTRDVFGTGKLPPANVGDICWPATWRVIRHETDQASKV
jgi:lipopolysaccharide transport system ATP-binding protein